MEFCVWISVQVYIFGIDRDSKHSSCLRYNHSMDTIVDIIVDICNLWVFGDRSIHCNACYLDDKSD